MKKMKRAAMLLGCLCMLCFTALHIAAADVPDPTEDFYVNDYASMLDTAAKDHIISINNKLYRDYDVQLVVVTVEDLNGEELETYAHDVFNAWGIGSDKTNRGILLVLAKREDDYWITQGKGLEKLLPSDMLGDLLNENLEADFAKKDYSAGVTKTVDALEKKITSVVPKVKSNKEEEKGSTTTAATTATEENDVSIFDAVIVILVIGGGIFGYKSYRKKHPKQPRQPKESRIVREPRERTRRYDDYYFTDERYYNDPRYYHHRHLYHHHHHDDHHHHDEHYHDRDDRYHESRYQERRTTSTSRPSSSNPSPAPNRGQGGSTNGGGAGRRKK